MELRTHLQVISRRKVPRGPGAIVLSGAEKFGQLGAVARLEVGPSGLAEQSEGQGAEREHGEAGLGPGAGGPGAAGGERHKDGGNTRLSPTPSPAKVPALRTGRGRTHGHGATV